MRTKQISVAGKTYWISWSGRSQIAMETFKRQPGYNARAYVAETAYRTLYEELLAGYQWAMRTGMNPEHQPPTYDELLDTVSMEEITDLSEDMTEIMAGVRNVVAKPPKKDEAGESED